MIEDFIVQFKSIKTLTFPPIYSITSIHSSNITQQFTLYHIPFHVNVTTTFSTPNNKILEKTSFTQYEVLPSAIPLVSLIYVFIASSIQPSFHFSVENNFLFHSQAFIFSYVRILFWYTVFGLLAAAAIP